ncbi:hypothetical protein TKK_0013844 [Trichogramma kaykai]|uniref:Tc1-like transposase DDE domain-containing protein n=1 Tax=Trichogramma kaykai TaxID=54128 RepID=A0ABD2WHE3_9HYME
MDRANFVPNNANLGLLQGLIEAGLSDTVIGERLGINRSTVWRWRARLDADLPLEDGRRGNSGVHKVSDEQLIGAMGRLEREPFASLELVNCEGNFGVTTKTLSKAIQQRTDIRFRRPAKKPQLRCANEVAWLLYAQQHVGRTPEQWRKTVFMDEKTFSSTKDGRVGVWRPIGSRLDKEYVKETTISGRHSIAFWGCMTGDGMSQLFEVDRTLTSPQYLDILDNWFYPSILEHYPDEDEIFIVEDNSPIHTARVIREWYDEHPHLR